ncbi:MAG: DUF4097 family beta strand repeat-containing protein [Acidobacteriaceae bacterium]
MASYPPPPPPPPPPGYDPRAQRRYQRDQFRAQMRAQRDAVRAQRQQIRYQMRGMRRGSVLGPLLLIAVGVLFLLVETSRLNLSRFWEWYGHWWPMLLVAAGIVLLAEWTFDQVHMRDPERPPYRRSAGFGVFLLLFFLVLAGVVVRNVHGYSSGYSNLFPGYRIDQNTFDEFFGDKHESDQTMDLAFPAGGSVAVVNPRGDVTIDGTSDDGRVHIAEHKQVYSHSDADAESKAQQLSPAVAREGTAVSINIAAMDGASADLVLTVPAAAAIQVNANRGDIHVASIKAPVAVTANHGEIELSAITGAAMAHINNGGSSVSAHSMGSGIAIEGRAQDITLSEITGPVSITGEFFGTTHLEHINGAVHLHTSRTDLQIARLDGEVESVPNEDLMVDQAVGPFALTTSNRNIRLDRIAGDVAVTDRNGTIELTAAPPLGAITLEDRNGSVKLILPERAGFSVQANTSNGNIDTDFPLSIQGSENHKSVNGTVGAGGPLLRITTTNSDISIDKGTVLPLPPLPPAPPKLTLAPGEPPRAPHVDKSKGAGVPVP